MAAGDSTAQRPATSNGLHASWQLLSTSLHLGSVTAAETLLVASSCIPHCRDLLLFISC